MNFIIIFVMLNQMSNMTNLKKYPISILSPKGLSAVSIGQPFNNAKSGLFLMIAIYKISSQIHPERIYIGSAVNAKKRKANHFSMLKKNSHHSVKLQRHCNKYGIEDLCFEILESVMFKEDLIMREQFYMNLLNPYFNICKTAGSCLGTKMSKETKLKISKSHIGLNTWAKGRKMSKEERLINSKSKIGINTWQKGKKHSEETKKKMSKSHMGLNTWAKGRKILDETKKKISLSISGDKHWNWQGGKSESYLRKIRLRKE